MFKWNKNKAIEKFEEKLRKEREPLWAQLDVDFMRALETTNNGAKNKAIAAKQSLRDVTIIDYTNVTNDAELWALWPTDLLG